MKICPATNQNTGMTLVEFVVVIFVMILAVLMLLPQLARRSYHPGRAMCVYNLRQIGLAFKIWGEDNVNQYPMNVSVTNGGAMEFARKGIAYPSFQVLSNRLKTPQLLICPEDKAHIAATNFLTGFGNSNLSYFVGLVANDANPQKILCGDANLEINSLPARTGILTLWTNSPSHGQKSGMILEATLVWQMARFMKF